MSKCYFGLTQVEYLGHFISSKRALIDLRKVQVVQQLPVPIIIKQLRGFLRLIGYYKRFVRNYGRMAQPLTTLCKPSGP